MNMNWIIILLGVRDNNSTVTPISTGPDSMGNNITPETAGNVSPGSTGVSTGRVLCNVGNLTMGGDRGILRPSRYSVGGQY